MNDPEPLPDDAKWRSADPADRVTLDESINMAFLVVLESMTPAERVAFMRSSGSSTPTPRPSATVVAAPPLRSTRSKVMSRWRASSPGSSSKPRT